MMYMNVADQLKSEFNQLIKLNTTTFDQLKELLLKQKPVEPVQHKLKESLDKMLDDAYKALSPNDVGNLAVIQMLQNDYNNILKKGHELNYSIFRNQLSDNLKQSPLIASQIRALRLIVEHINNHISEKDKISEWQKKLDAFHADNNAKISSDYRENAKLGQASVDPQIETNDIAISGLNDLIQSAEKKAAKYYELADKVVPSGLGDEFPLFEEIHDVSSPQQSSNDEHTEGEIQSTRIMERPLNNNVMMYMDVEGQLQREFNQLIHVKTTTFTQLKELLLKQEPVDAVQHKLKEQLDKILKDTYQGLLPTTQRSLEVIKALQCQYENILHQERVLNYTVFRKQCSENLARSSLSESQKRALRLILRHINNQISEKNNRIELQKKVDDLYADNSKLIDDLLRIKHGNVDVLLSCSKEYRELRDAYLKLGKHHSDLSKEIKDYEAKDPRWIWLFFSGSSGFFAVGMSIPLFLSLAMPIAADAFIVLPIVIVVASLISLCLLGYYIYLVVNENNNRTACANTQNEMRSNKLRQEELKLEIVVDLGSKIKANNAEINRLNDLIQDSEKKAGEFYELADKVVPSALGDGKSFFTSIQNVSSSQETSNDKQTCDGMQKTG